LIKIESDILYLNVQFDNPPFTLFGDLNARTSKLSDYVVFDRCVAEQNFDNSIDQYMSISNLSYFGIPFEQFSEDCNNVDNYGHRLLELMF
jgi:hypothetical protein